MKDWRKYFLECVRSVPFVPPLMEYIERYVGNTDEILAHTSLDKYIKYYCDSGSGSLWSIISMVYKPNRIVEFGAATGMRTNLIAKLNPQAQVLGIELIKDCGPGLCPSGFLAKDNKNVEIIIGNCLDFHYFDTDMFFIDADHSESSVIKDSEKAWKYRNLSRDWCIIWDDYPLESVKSGVNKFAKEKDWEVQSFGGYAIIGTIKLQKEWNV